MLNNQMVTLFRVGLSTRFLYPPWSSTPTNVSVKLPPKSPVHPQQTTGVITNKSHSVPFIHHEITVEVSPITKIQHWNHRWVTGSKNLSAKHRAKIWLERMRRSGRPASRRMEETVYFSNIKDRREGEHLWPPGSLKHVHFSTRWYPPSDVCWFINPINYRYKYNKP